MTKKFFTPIILGLVFISFSGCSSRAWYEGFREAERQNCYKIGSQSERRECLDRVNGRSFEQYKKDRDESLKQ